MGRKSFVIFADAGPWRVGTLKADTPVVLDTTVPPPELARPEDMAEKTAAVLGEHGYAGEGIILALPSQWCLCATVSTEGLPRKGRRLAMLYRLEEKLPVAAEDIAADFLPSHAQAFGICVQVRTVAPIVDALEARGVAVQSICPVALLALQGALDSGCRSRLDRLSADADAGGPDECDALLWGARGQTDLFLLEAGRPRAWAMLPSDARDVSLHLRVQAARAVGSSLRVRPLGTDPPALDAAADVPGVTLLDPDRIEMSIAATGAAHAILLGGATPWLDLRRDGLAVRDPYRQIRTPLTYMTIAAVVFLACLCIGLLWRAGQYDGLAARDDARQREVFTRTLPGQVVPAAGIRSRMESVERNLRRRSSIGAPAGVSMQATSLALLRDVPSRLPADLRYRLLDVRLDGARFFLEGQARSHADADAIAGALRKDGVLQVEPPRTEQLPERRVSFSIVGASASASEVKAPNSRSRR